MSDGPLWSCFLFQSKIFFKNILQNLRETDDDLNLIEMKL